MGNSNNKEQADPYYDPNDDLQEASEIQPVNRSNNPTLSQGDPNSNYNYNSVNQYPPSSNYGNSNALQVPNAYSNNLANSAMGQSRKPEAKPTMIQGSNAPRQVNPYPMSGEAAYSEEKKTQYVPTNIAAVRNNEMQEDLPQFSQYVKALSSAITYPLDPTQFGDNSLLPEKFEFTPNSNSNNPLEICSTNL